MTGIERNSDTPRILIVGGGVGGLTMAIALRRQGLPIDIVEQSKVLAAVGAGITIQANAMAVFNALGIVLPPEDMGPIGYFEMVNASGQCLMSGDPGDVDIAHPSINIHRADLQRSLLKHLEALGGTLQTGRSVFSVQEHADEGVVEVCFEDGSKGSWDLVIGIDGLNSTVRRAVLGEAATRLRYSGQTCWRLAVEAPELVPDITVERWSTQRRIGLVPLSRGRVYVYMVESAAEGTPGPGSASADALKSRFLGIDDRLDPILHCLAEREEAGSPLSVHHGDLYEQPLISFGQGRVILLGDAAHGMTPNMGQGAGTAIEDAAELSLQLPTYMDDLSSLPDALDSSRRKRVAAVQRMSWRIGAMAHIKWRLICWIRDLLLRLLPASMGRRQMISLWQPGIDLARRINQSAETGD